MILRVEVPNQGRRSAYIQMSEKAIFDWALVSCAAAAKVEGNKLSDVSIFLGQVSNVPYQVKAANDFLEGKTLDDATAAKAADLILEKAHVQAHNGYKVPIVRALVKRMRSHNLSPDYEPEFLQTPSHEKNVYSGARARRCFPHPVRNSRISAIAGAIGQCPRSARMTARWARPIATAPVPASRSDVRCAA